MKTLTKSIQNLKSESDIKDFLESLFTSDEIIEFEKRLEIIKMIVAGIPQREISKKLNVGIATVSRGSKVVNNKKSPFKKANSDQTPRWWG